MEDPALLGELQAMSLEEHHGDIDAPLCGRLYSLSQPGEVTFVKLREVETRFTVGRELVPCVPMVVAHRS